MYWFKDGKQISQRSEHYRISRDPDGTCSLHTAAASLDDDGNYTVMAGNPGVLSHMIPAALQPCSLASGSRGGHFIRLLKLTSVCEGMNVTATCPHTPKTRHGFSNYLHPVSFTVVTE